MQEGGGGVRFTIGSLRSAPPVSVEPGAKIILGPRQRDHASPNGSDQRTSAIVVKAPQL